MNIETKGGEPADERAAFEEEVSRHIDPARSPETLARDEDGGYHEWGTALAWECWQARAALQSKACASVGRPMPNVAHEGESGADIEFREGWNACLSALATPPAAPAVTEGASDVLDAFEQDHLGFHLDHNAIQAWINKLRSALAAPAAAVPEKWIDDPHDIEQGQMLNPEWLRLHGITAQQATQAPAATEAPSSAMQINGEPATAHSILAALVDIDDDATNNAPEHRCYIPSAFNDTKELARRFLSTSTQQAAKSAAASGLVERLKMEAQIHAGEARAANATIAEIYRIVTGSTGEPGNWHGAEPVRKCIEDLRAQVAAKSAAPAAVAFALRFPSDNRINLSTVFDTEAEAAEYAERCEGAVVVPLYAAPMPATQAPAAVGLEELHDLLYTAQRTTGEVQDRAIGAALAAQGDGGTTA